jgi:nucleotide-binding universal stress UspA family protein
MTSSPLYKGMHCHVVRVATGSAASEEPGVAEKLKAAGLSVTTADLRGDVGPALLTYHSEHNIDLMVMGAFGHSRLREFLFGSVTVTMLGGSTVPRCCCAEGGRELARTSPPLQIPTWSC